MTTQKINAEVGSLITLVFKAAPFGPGIDEATGQPGIQLNHFKGIFRGYHNGQMLLENPGAERSIVWRIEDADILMWCEMGKVEVVSTVS